MLNILVVDDSTMIRKLLTKLLEDMGHNVVAQAKSGKEAIELYAETIPDLVTMDITMPIMNGIYALQKIKKNYKDAKVIVITAQGEERLVMDAITSGAKAYILKPLNEDKIKEVITKLFPIY